jgi:PAS domain S-box-containing protein
VQQRARALADHTASALNEAALSMRLLARTAALQRLDDPMALRREFDGFLAQRTAFVWVGVAGNDGRVIAGSRGWLDGQSIAARPVFQRAGQALVTGDARPALMLAPLMAAADIAPQELLDFSLPLLDAQGRRVGVLVAHLGVQWIDALLASQGAAVDIRQPMPAGSQAAISVAAHGGGTSVLRAAGSGPAPDQDAFAASHRVNMRADMPLHWQAVVTHSRDVALAPARHILQLLSVAAALAAAGLSAAACGLALRFSRRWQPMTTSRVERHARERDAGTLRRVFDQIPVAVAVLDTDLRVEYLNPAYERLLGWTADEVRGQPAASFLWRPAQQPAWLQMLDRLRQEPAEVVARFDASTRRGALAPVQWHFTPLRDEAGNAVGALAVLHDIRAEQLARSEARQLTEQLGQSASRATRWAQRLADLSRSLLRQERDTTRRLAHALHEDVGQVLAALRLQAESSRGATAPGAADLVAQAQHGVRRLLDELIPPLLDDQGLEVALDNELRRQAMVTSPPALTLRVRVRPSAVRWPADVEYAAFMVAKLAIAQAIGRGCRTLTVALLGQPGALRLRVVDDGIAHAQAASSREGLGLSMRERALAVGATLNRCRAPLGHTCLELRWEESPNAVQFLAPPEPHSKGLP